MKSLQDSAIREDIGQRLRRLSVDSARQWGKMTVSQTVCHLADAYRMAVGDHKVADVSTLWTRTGLKWIVLYAPMPWPKGVRTFPELNQELVPLIFDFFKKSLVIWGHRGLERCAVRTASLREDLVGCFRPLERLALVIVGVHVGGDGVAQRVRAGKPRLRACSVRRQRTARRG